MRILLLSWRGQKHPNAGGAEVSTNEHAKGWIKAGHDVTLFTSSFAGCKKEEIIDGVKIQRNGKQVFGVQWEFFKWYLFGYHPKFDLVIDQFHGIPFFTPLYIKTKKLAFIHETTKEVWKLNTWPWPFNQVVSFIGQIAEPWLFKLLYKDIPFMTVSKSTKRDLVDWGIPSKNITIIHNGIKIPEIKNLPQKEMCKTVIFLGSISKDKGVEDAVKIFKKIGDQKKDWQFWVVGKSDSRYLETIKDLAEDLGILDNVRFFGYVSDRKKFELLSKAHLLINPSIREGWGLVVIEAARVGTPTVGYNVAGLRDSIINGKTGILCNPNPTDCSLAIIKLISNRRNYGKLRKNSIQWSKNFSWEKSYKESLKLMEKIVRQSNF